MFWISRKHKKSDKENRPPSHRKKCQTKLREKEACLLVPKSFTYFQEDYMIEATRFEKRKKKNFEFSTLQWLKQNEVQNNPAKNSEY